jgi:hypothetical protein
VIEVLIQFIQDYLGEESDVSKDSSDESLRSIKKTMRQKDPLSRQGCIFIFDSASMMDEESVSMLVRLYSMANNFVCMMLVNQDSQGGPIMPQLPKKNKKS